MVGAVLAGVLAADRDRDSVPMRTSCCRKTISFPPTLTT